TSVPLDQRIPKPHQTRRVVYRAEVAAQDPTKIFATGATQRVKKLDDRVAEITVVALGQEEIVAAESRQPDDEDLASNTLIQSDDPRVVQLAQSVLPDEQDKHALALALEQLTHASITA